MIVIFGALFGAVLGGLIARKRKGNRLDILHYAGIFALAFALVGMIITIIITRVLS